MVLSDLFCPDKCHLKLNVHNHFLTLRLKEEKRRTTKAHAARALFALERRFPADVKFVTDELGPNDEIAVSLVAAVNEIGNKGQAFVLAFLYQAQNFE